MQIGRINITIRKGTRFCKINEGGSGRRFSCATFAAQDQQLFHTLTLPSRIFRHNAVNR